MKKILEEDIDYLLKCKMFDWELIKGKSFFITGATGLVGSLLVRVLQNANKKKGMNIKIYCLVRNIDKAICMFGQDQMIKYICGDVKKSIMVSEEVDYIIHCASITSSKTMITHPVDTLMTAVDGTRNILELAKEKQVESMVYISSMEAYGVVFEDKRITESTLGYIDLSNVRSVYPEGKRTCEMLCKAYESEYGVNVKIARLAQTFGAGVSKEDTRVFAQFAKSVLNGQNIVLHTEGKSYGNYCYTIDAVSAVFCILLKGNSGEAYNVVNEENTMTIKDMAEKVSSEIGANIKVIIDIPDQDIQYGYAPDTKLMLSSEKIKKLGWKPTYGLIDMYRRMIDFWKWD